MSCIIKKNDLSIQDKKYIQKTLSIEADYCYDLDDIYLRLPFAFAYSAFQIDYKIPNIYSLDFQGQLRSEQTLISKKALKILNEVRSVMIACHPGFGKTIIAINLACQLKTKTLIIINRKILIEQWKTSINNFNKKNNYQYIDSETSELNDNVNFYIVNAIIIKKKGYNFFKTIDLVIIDEAHQIITKILSRGLFYLYPSYLIGLSATPYRFDKYNEAIGWFFGENVLNYKLQKNHFVYYFETDFVPELKQTKKGLDWNAVLNSQAENKKRNELIVNIIKKYPEKTWLILVKRVSHAEILSDMFKKENKVCETLFRSKLLFNKNAKILIGTTSKIGVGFDHININALFIAADVKNYFIQFLGRCMRKPDCEPMVVDLIDNFSVLKKHFEERMIVYKQHGGKVNKLDYK